MRNKIGTKIPKGCYDSNHATKPETNPEGMT